MRSRVCIDISRNIFIVQNTGAARWHVHLRQEPICSIHGLATNKTLMVRELWPRALQYVSGELLQRLQSYACSGKGNEFLPQKIDSVGLIRVGREQ